MATYIESERLILRDWREEDLGIFAEMNRDPKVMEYFPAVLVESESRAFYDRICQELTDYGYGLYAVEVRSSGEFIGYIGLHHTTFKSDFSPCLEIGWRLKHSAWGKGYAPEGAYACLEHAFRQLQLPELYSFTALPNKRSERVMQKIGMQRVKEFDHPLLPSGHALLRHILYQITAKSFLGNR